jgi:asparagine synthase (glutamine-hydrolysing)
MGASALPLDERMARWNTFFPDLRALLRPEVAEALAKSPASRMRKGSALEAPLAWQRAVFAECQGDSVLSRVLEHNFRTYLPFDLLVKADRTSMAHGLELRSPFLDLALMEYAFALPPAYVRRGPETKRVLKYAFRDLLPEPILKRGKMGFGVPLGTWFRGDLQALLQDHLGPGARLYEYLDARAVARLLDEHGRSLADHGQRLWALLTLEIWLRTLRAEARLPLPSAVEAAMEANGEPHRSRPEKALA